MGRLPCPFHQSIPFVNRPSVLRIWTVCWASTNFPVNLKHTADRGKWPTGDLFQRQLSSAMIKRSPLPRHKLVSGQSIQCPFAHQAEFSFSRLLVVRPEANLRQWPPALTLFCSVLPELQNVTDMAAALTRVSLAREKSREEREISLLISKIL